MYFVVPLLPNPGTTDLEIESTSKSCSCLKGDIDRKRIPPGGSAKITLTVQPNTLVNSGCERLRRNMMQTVVVPWQQIRIVTTVGYFGRSDDIHVISITGDTLNIVKPGGPTEWWKKVREKTTCNS